MSSLQKILKIRILLVIYTKFFVADEVRAFYFMKQNNTTEQPDCTRIAVLEPFDLRRDRNRKRMDTKPCFF